MQGIRMLSSSTTVQHDETERLKSLLQYEILDTLPDPAFDEIARMRLRSAMHRMRSLAFLTGRVCGFKSTVGFFRSADKAQRLALPVSFARWQATDH